MLGGGSRIRTLEGISRRIYRPLPCSPSVVAYSTAPAHPSSPGPHTPMTVGRFRRIGAVCGPSQPTEQHSTMRCDADQRQVAAGQRRSRGCGQEACLVSQKILSISTTLALAGRAAVSGMASHQKKCRTCRVGGVWRPLNLPQGLPHAIPGAEPHGACGGPAEGCPRASVWPGDARSRGRHTTPGVQDRRRSC